MFPIDALRMRNASSGGTDPSFSNVILLMGFDGSDGSTTMTDESPTPATYTAIGAAQIDTGQSKFGGSSLQVTNVGDYVTTPYNSEFDLGSSDFCIEMFVRFNVTSGTHVFFCRWDGFNPINKAYNIQYGGGNLNWIYYTTGGTFRLVQKAWTPSTGTWYHIAVTRSGNNFRLFVDGTQLGTTDTFADTIMNGTASAEPPILIGRQVDNGTAAYFNGWMDELRVTKGVARYTSNFTAPTAKFPRS